MEYKQFISQVILDILYSGFWIYIPTQAIVYLSGRMMGILNANWTRNLLALVSTLGLSFGYIKMNLVYTGTLELTWLMIHWASMGVMWYTLVGFTLYKRIDHLLDKRIADDEEPKRRKK